MADKILVIDDSDDTRDMMAKLLELESFAVVTARDGRVGIELAASERPDLIITDINMPDLNGIEMIQQLRSHRELDAVPIFALTAYGNQVIAEAMEAGADHAATKPLEFDVLLSAIRVLLDRSKEKGTSFR